MRNEGKDPIPIIAMTAHAMAGDEQKSLDAGMNGHVTKPIDPDQLFATLDPTRRRLDLGEGRSVVLADTVGFVRDLPHELVAAFRSTLTETRDASLLLHVIDASDPHHEDRMRQVHEVLEVWCYRVEESRIERVEGRNLSRARGEDGEPSSHGGPV